MLVEPFSEAALDRLSRAIGDAESGGSLTRLFASGHLPQPEPPGATKWRRVYASLDAEQRRTRSGVCVIAFIQASARPQRWADRAEFDALRNALNQALIYDGLTVYADGTVGRVKAATTHDEAAAATAKRLQLAMSQRGGHSEVFRYCQAELVAEDCFGAVFEATKGLAERIREMTGLDLDGHELVDVAIFANHPRVALNSRRTDTERNEQRGIGNLMKGLFSAFRNPPAHEPKATSWHVSEADALDVLSTLSLIHRRLDTAAVVPDGEATSGR